MKSSLIKIWFHVHNSIYILSFVRILEMNDLRLKIRLSSYVLPVKNILVIIRKVIIIISINNTNPFVFILISNKNINTVLNVKTTTKIDRRNNTVGIIQK